jgi:hypothetical protein
MLVKASWKPWFSIGATVAFAVVSGIACGGGGGDPASGGAAAGASAAPAKKIAVGQPMKAKDGQAATVVSFKRNYQSTNQFEHPAAGKECVQVHMAFLNGSKQEWHGPTGAISVVDDSGQKSDSYTMCGSSSRIDSLVAGGHAEADVFFEVKAGVPLNVTFKPNIFADEVYQTPLQ